MHPKPPQKPVNVAYRPIVTESVAVQISENIRELITGGYLQVNDRLPTEDELARQFKVSRPTIREALKRLAAQHLVRSRRGPTGGTFVSQPSLGELNANLSIASTLLVSLGEFDVDGILEAREELELVCIRLASARRLDQHLDALAEEIAYQRQDKITDVDFCASDVRFHRLIVDAAGNAIIRFLMHAVIEALQPVENMIIFRVRDRKVIIQHHVDMLNALRDRDAASAEKAIRDQIAYIRSQVVAADDAREKRRAQATQPPVGPARKAPAKRKSKA